MLVQYVSNSKHCISLPYHGYLQLVLLTAFYTTGSNVQFIIVDAVSPSLIPTICALNVQSSSRL